jgi:adenosylcobinamide-GDP ribazoletransferase
MVQSEGGHERRAAWERRAAAADPRTLIVQLATAVRFLTVVPVPGVGVPVGESALFFPVVGLGLGAALLGADRWLADATSPLPRALALSALLASLSGGRGLVAVARVGGGLLARHRAEALVRMRARRPHALGVGAVLVVVALKVWALASVVGALRTRALLFAPMLARWSIVALAFGSRPARSEGVGFDIVRSLKFREFALASVFALGVTLAYVEAWGLVVILVLALVSIGCRVLVHRTLGGVTGDLLGAIGEVAEGLALVLFALGSPAAGPVR